MSTTYTTNAKFGKPALNDRAWNTPLNANADALDALATVGGLCVTTAEVPSATLNIAVAPGTFRTPGGTIVSYAGTTSTAITASTTAVVYLDTAGTLHTAASYPAAPHIRLATVVAGATTISSVTDNRLALTAAPMSGRATLVAGTVTVSATWMTSTCNIILTSQVDGGTPGWLRVSARTAGTSFTITSSSTSDTSTIAYRSDEA